MDPLGKQLFPGARLSQDQNRAVVLRKAARHLPGLRNSLRFANNIGKAPCGNMAVQLMNAFGRAFQHPNIRHVVNGE